MSIDTASQTWQAIEEWALSRIDNMHFQNEHMGSSEQLTAFIRGKIAFARQLHLLSDDEEAETSSTSADYGL